MKINRKTNLNEIIKNGIYYYSVNSKIINTPCGKENSSGNLFVLEQDQNIVLQILLSYGNLYCRQKLEIGEWSPWVNLSSGCEAYILPAASTEELGGVKIGDGIDLSEDGLISVKEYSLPTARKDRLGGIKVGKNLNISNDGILSANDQIYVLPEATDNRLGGIRLGSGLYVDEVGRTCVSFSPTAEKNVVHQVVENPYILPVASKDMLGGIKVGENLNISDDGILSVEITPPEMDVASSDKIGGIKVDGEIFKISEEGYLQVDLSDYFPQEKRKNFSYEIEGEEYSFSFNLEEEVRFLENVVTSSFSHLGLLGGDFKPFEISAKNKDGEQVALFLNSTSLLDLYVNGFLNH